MRTSRILTPVAPLALAATVTLLAACAEAAPTTGFDLVISGGRVIDPESGLDAVRNIGIVGGRIEAISEETLTGEHVIHVPDHVVALSRA